MLTKAHFTVRTCPCCGQPVNGRNDAAKFFEGEDEGGESCRGKSLTI